MSAYYSHITNLPDEHPEVHEFMRNGGFSVQLSNDNTFGRIPVDQTLEETVNKDTQTPGGKKKGKVTAYEPEGPSGRRLSPVSVALSD